MSDTIQIIGNAMRAETETLRAISQNVANAQTIAYRRQVPVSHVQFDELLDINAAGQLQAPEAQFKIAIDMQTATLKSTGEPLNVALADAGFFVLQTAQGPVLTRRGDFHVSADGTLLSFSGDPVLGEKGPIQLGSGVPAIAADGSVRIGNDMIDRLRIVSVAEQASLESLGDGTYRAPMNNLVEGENRPTVRQGFLEASNVVPVNEMLQLMETVRRFEAEQKFARAYDGMLEKAISELGKI